MTGKLPEELLKLTEERVSIKRGTDTDFTPKAKDAELFFHLAMQNIQDALASSHNGEMSATTHCHIPFAISNLVMAWERMQAE